MSFDPIAGATERALDDLFARGLVARSLNTQVRSGAEAGARALSMPLRALHREGLTGAPRTRVCTECMTAWPCSTARLIYSEEELK